MSIVNDSAVALGTTVSCALIQCAGAIEAARAAADALAAGDIDKATAYLSPYQTGHGTWSSGLVLDDPSSAVTDNAPIAANPTSGY